MKFFLQLIEEAVDAANLNQVREQVLSFLDSTATTTTLSNGVVLEQVYRSNGVEYAALDLPKGVRYTWAVKVVDAGVVAEVLPDDFVAVFDAEGSGDVMPSLYLHTMAVMWCLMHAVA